MNYQNIIDNINKSINNLLNQYRKIFSREDYIEIKKNQMILNKNKFNSLEEIKQIENKILTFFAKIWEAELTDIDNFKIGDKFKFVITAPTVHAKNYDFSNLNFISASLITDKHMGTFNKINYGIICSVDKDNLLSVSSSDSHTVVPKENSGFEDKYFYTATTSDLKKLYNKIYIDSLKLPSEVEINMIKDNIKENKDFISQNFKAIYSDITLDPKRTKMKGIILFKPYSDNDLKEVSELASKFNLKVKIIPKDLYYNKISIKNVKSEKHNYDIRNLDTIEFILDHLDQISQEYSNLIFEKVSNLISIKDEDKSGKLIIDKTLNNLSIYLPNDIRYFKIDFSEFEKKYYIDDIEKTKEEFKNSLNNNLENENIKHK